MRAPGEASGMMALEIAMGEMAKNLGMDPVKFRILNDTQVDPKHPQRKFSQRRSKEWLRPRRCVLAETSATCAPARYPTASGWSA